MDGLYDSDILEWSTRQAELLRRVAAGERLNEAPDWSNIIEEVESVGREQLHSVESLLVQAIAHMLKAQAWPSTAYVAAWEAEARRFRGDAASRYAPSMRQKLDLDRLYRRAQRSLPTEVDGEQPLPIPPTPKMTLDELLRED